MARPLRLQMILVVLLVAWSQIVSSEIIPFELILDASSEEVRFIRGWLEAPAHIDLSHLRFVTTKEPDFDHGDDWFNEDDEFPGDQNSTRTDTPTTGEGTPAPSPGQDSELGADTSAPTSPSTADEANGEATEAPTPLPAADGVAATPVPTALDVSGGASPSPVNEEDESTPVPTDTRRTRNLEENHEGGVNAQRVKQILDVVLFMVPNSCKQDAWGGCDWSTLGVGSKDNEVDGGVSYCCSADTANRGICSSDQIGHLIVDTNKFFGDHRSVDVPTSAVEEFQLPNALFEVETSGDYVLVLANCDDFGLQVFALGTMEWKSVDGYLPGEMFGLMLFYAALTVMYLVLVLWYWCGMKMYQEAAIPIQKFIFAAMIIGLLELFFRALDLGTWNLDGIRSGAIIWTALVLGVLKRAISRCLIVMVSMGWGIVRDSLGSTLIKIILLGLVYAGLTLVRDFLTVLAVTKVESWSLSTEEELVDLAVVISLALLFVNLIFYFWILSSLNATTEYLKNMNQTSKLRRHLRLRCLIMTAFVIAVGWLIFSFVDGVTSMLGSDQVWMLEAAMHTNYLFVLFGVAVLWRPNANAKEYALQMELPDLGGDEENELELSCVVPSAAEDLDDGNDPDHPDGLPVNHGVVS